MPLLNRRCRFMESSIGARNQNRRRGCVSVGGGGSPAVLVMEYALWR